MKQLIAYTLILITLVSTMGIKVNKHLCKKEGLLVSYFVDNNQCKCHKVEVETHSCCHKKAPEKTHEKNCCGDESEFYKIDSNFPFETEHISVSPFLAELPFIYSPRIETSSDISDFYPETIVLEKPPNSGRQVLAKIQSFLI